MSYNLGNRSVKVGITNIPIVDKYEDIKCTWWLDEDTQKFYISLSALTQREVYNGMFVLQFMRFKYNKCSNNKQNPDNVKRFDFASPYMIRNDEISARVDLNIQEINIRKIDITEYIVPFLCGDVFYNHPYRASSTLANKFYRLYKFGISYQYYNGSHYETKTGNIDSTLLKVRTSYGAKVNPHTNVMSLVSGTLDEIDRFLYDNDILYIQYK